MNLCVKEYFYEQNKIILLTDELSLVYTQKLSQQRHVIVKCQLSRHKEKVIKKIKKQPSI